MKTIAHIATGALLLILAWALLVQTGVIPYTGKETYNEITNTGDNPNDE